MKLNTVNVIEYRNDEIETLHSFSDDEEGNKEAEDLFSDIMRERDGMTDEDIKVAMADGFYEEGTFQLFLISNSPSA